eukprot:CAMPEP_0113673660 /NCGR_PEP_ID=MMETSP0038_2-20120614/6980_1 /TAXON_ID=2898 /ORGANISM="Cryptomonas paramecium" /LENGTH=306 /DNA_ID=CAMNT_0000590141 /DNA_START=29 /DNA_END=945 /DNA_ORIENTATION=+ /assembly_acc=CAM_ASM_000170
MSVNSQKSRATSVRNMLRSRHFEERQDEREISEEMVDETLKEGAVLDEQGNRKLHVSDHFVVITQRDSHHQKPLGITAFPHGLTGEWRAVQDYTGGKLQLDTCYEFLQFKKCCIFCGIMDEGTKTVEIGFGLHQLQASQWDSFFKTISIVYKPATDEIQVQLFQLFLDKVLCRSKQPIAPSSHSEAGSIQARSSATTRCSGAFQSIDAVIGGENKTIPIFRRLHTPLGETASLRRAVQSWVQYDPDETDEILPTFDASDLHDALSRLVAPAQARGGGEPFTGRWREDMSEQGGGTSQLDMVAVPLG